MWRWLSCIVVVVGCGRDLGPRLPAPPDDDVPAAWRLQRFPYTPSYDAPNGAVVDAVAGADALWLAVGEYRDGVPPYRIERLARDGTRTALALPLSAPPRLVPQRDGGVLVLGTRPDDPAVTATCVAPDGAIRTRATVELDRFAAGATGLHAIPGTDGVGAALLFASVWLDGEEHRSACVLATIGADGALERRALGDDGAYCEPRGLAARGGERVVMFSNLRQTVVMALDVTGAPRWTQPIAPRSGVEWLGLAATDDTIALVSSYTEQAPPWVAPAGSPTPVTSVHVHAIDPGDGTLGWDYDLPLEGTFGLRSAQLVAAGSSFVLLSRFSDAGGSIHGERATYADADVVAIDSATGAPQWHRVLRGDRGGSGYPAIERLDLTGGAHGEVLVFGAYVRGLELGGVTARGLSRYAGSYWTGKRYYDEPSVGFVARLR